MLKKFILQLRHSLVTLYRSICAVVNNRRGEMTFPDHLLADLAKCFAKDIRAFFAIERNREAYRQWIQEQKQQATKTAETNSVLHATDVKQDVTLSVRHD